MTSLKPFRVEGSFKMGLKTTKFSIETIGKDAQAARERILSTIGSKHRVDRHHMRIDAVTEIKPEDVTDAVVQHQLEAGA